MNLARLVSLGIALSCASLAYADETETLAAPYDPVQHWEIDYETGVIWRFSGDATPLGYTILPQILTVKSPLVGTVRPFFGGDLVIRNRFSLLGEPKLRRARRLDEAEEQMFDGHIIILEAAGGGLGWLDSKGHEIKGAQGEDYNLNWLAYTGVRILTKKRLSGSVGAYFQHISNHGMNSVNPGVNAVGPMASVGWHF